MARRFPVNSPNIGQPSSYIPGLASYRRISSCSAFDELVKYPTIDTELANVFVATTECLGTRLMDHRNSVEENARNQRAQFQDILRQLAELQVQSGSGSLSLSTPVLDRRVSELTDRFNAVTRVPDKLADHELRNTMDEPTDVVSHCAAHSFSPADGTPEPTASPELQMRDLGAGAVHSDTMDSIYSFPSNAHVASGETQHEPTLPVVVEDAATIVLFTNNTMNTPTIASGIYLPPPRRARKGKAPPIGTQSLRRSSRLRAGATSPAKRLGKSH
ncbi:hypothetical protein C8R46DRAFT_1227995 [Mycena filopes]|nr:hypothetical protein C8R46DRAFT_1227995 [Mycena filopes]